MYKRQAVFNQYKDVPGVVFLIDPPYLSTDVGTYNMYWLSLIHISFNEADKPEGFAIRDVCMTLEIEYSTANVTDTDAELITCLGQLDNGNRYGLIVTCLLYTSRCV